MAENGVTPSVTPGVTPGKKRRSGPYASIEQKLECLRRLEEGASIIELAEEYGTTDRNIRRWKADSSKISQFPGDVKKRKSLKKPHLEELDTAMHELVVQERLVLNHHLSVHQICFQANKMNQELGGPANFSASNGWFSRFSERHGLHSLQVNGETLSADIAAANQFVVDLKSTLETGEYDYDNIYNFDEAGLFWKSLPSRTYALQSGTAAKGTKLQKDRLTLGVCANATGTHKLPLLVVGKYQKPRCFKNNAEIVAMPVTYKSQRKAWMTGSLFLDWFLECFMPETKQHQRSRGCDGPEKVLLLVDNAASHKLPTRYTDNGRYTVLFLPPNTTSVIQPMDQGVISKVKRLYRRHLVGRLVKSGVSHADFYKTLNVKEACLMVHEAWEAVTAQNVRRSFRKLIPEVDQPDPLAEVEQSPPPSPVDDVQELTQMLQGTPYDVCVDEMWTWCRETRQDERMIEASSVENEDDRGEEEDDTDRGILSEKTLAAWKVVNEVAETYNLPPYEAYIAAVQREQELQESQNPTYTVL